MQLRAAVPVFSAALLIGVLSAACGSPSSAPPASSSTTTTTTVAPSTSSTSSTVPGPATCSTADLAASASFGGAAAGTSIYTVTVTNNGTKSCSLDGFPTYEFFGPTAGGGAGAGPKVTLAATHTGSAPEAVTIAPKSGAQSQLRFSDIASDGGSCVEVASALLTPPGSGESLSVPISFNACGGTVSVEAFGPQSS